MCGLAGTLPTVHAQLERVSWEAPTRPADPLVETVFYLTVGIEADDRLLASRTGVEVIAAHLAPGVEVDSEGRLYGTPRRVGTFHASIRLCRGARCSDEPLTIIVLRNRPWQPGALTFPGRVGMAYDERIGIEGGPPGVIPTFTVTKHDALPAGVTIGPDGHVGGVPERAGVSQVPLRICVAGDCSGAVVTLIVV
jgi:hypothetical protein